VSPATQLMSPGFDGTSKHMDALIEPKLLDTSKLPKDFELAVVYGPSGSGKSSLLQDLAKYYGQSNVSDQPSKFEFPKDMAICSHPGFKGESIDRLSCVGLNKVPSWLKPAGVLSDGERQRVLCALSLQSGAILDDFAVVVDESNAASMAASLAKFVRSRGLRRVLLGTTKRSVLPFLAPDFVVFAETGVIAANPWTPEQRKLSLTIDPDVEGFTGGKGGGWRGPTDDMQFGTAKKEQGAGPKREPRRLSSASKQEILEVSVTIDDACHEAADAFDYEFTGRTEQRIFNLDLEKLGESELGYRWKLGTIVGPSGTGKSCNMKRIAEGKYSEIPLSWDTSLAVLDQLHSDKHEALALVSAAALPTAAALRPFHVLSSGERARAELARHLGDAKGHRICLDEFTSCLDRTTARKVCHGISKYVRSTPRGLQVVVATVHEDIVDWLLPDWTLESGSGVVTVFDGEEPTASSIDALHRRLEFMPRSLSKATGLEVDEVRELLKPPSLSFQLRRLDGCTQSREVYQKIFEEHHYMKGAPPMGLYGLILRDSSNRPAAFHGCAIMVGAGFTNMSMRESRLVVLPEFQGFGLGPRLSNCVGKLLAASGATLNSRTAHPRLGAYREAHPELWRPTSTNKKLLKASMGSSLLKSRANKKKQSSALQQEHTVNNSCLYQEPLAEESGQPAEESAAALGEPVLQVCPPSLRSLSSVLRRCLACEREQLRAKGKAGLRGRPPKHTCGQQASQLPQQSSQGAQQASQGAQAEPRPRICFSHRYVGHTPAAPLATPQRKRSNPELDSIETPEVEEHSAKVRKLDLSSLDFRLMPELQN